MDFREDEDLILPPETDLGLYSGVYGIGGGGMKTRGTEEDTDGGRTNADMGALDEESE